MAKLSFIEEEAVFFTYIVCVVLVPGERLPQFIEVRLSVVAKFE